MNARLAFAACSITLLLAACGGQGAQDADASAQAPAQDEALPKPDPDGGAVTGMPAKPGPGPIGPPTPPASEDELLPTPEALADAALAEDGSVALPSPDATQQTALATGAAIQNPPEPTPADAAAVVREYYAALGGGDYARARALWSEGVGAGGHGMQELAAQYAGTAALAIEVGAPGRVEPAAGSRYIKVPVNLTRTLADGSVQRSTGVVALRRAMVDGATAEQRAWRIASADLRVQPAP